VAQRPDRLLQGEPVTDGRSQPLGKQVGMLDQQRAGNVVGCEKRAEAQQVLGRRRLLSKPS
jgi:hypothetical protein